NAAEAVTGERPTEFARMTWLEAQERYGSDKPDTRFGMELVELTPIFEGTEARVFQAPCVKGIRMEGGVEALSRNQIDALVETCQRWGAKGLAWMKVIDGESGPALDAGVAKFLSADESSQVIAALEAQPGDMVFLVADERRLVRHVLGLLRLELGKPPVNEGGLNFLWVVDFPLFETIADNGKPIPAHHPFTMPHEDDWDLLDGSGEDLLKVRSQAYDLVLNGWELGSGSIRINRSDVQNRIFELLGIGEEERQAKFGFFIDAFRYGAPPHGGFAFGLDRLTALLAGETNIREVIAFPKTQSGADPLTNAPSPIDDGHLDDVVGQRHLLAPGRPLRALIEGDRLSSVIFWGPPGTGKTSLSRLIASTTEKVFVELSAVTASVKDVREEIASARHRLGERGTGTILFLDE
ncbi:MAG: AAA family ATPase, partial [Actinobacteria bacterium]|nr:AAA family ATPase [Actinomycetota bacterium]